MQIGIIIIVALTWKCRGYPHTTVDYSVASFQVCNPGGGRFFWLSSPIVFLRTTVPKSSQVNVYISPLPPQWYPVLL